MNGDIERQQFESHFLYQGGTHPDFKRSPDGLYNLNDVQQTWEGWKARAGQDRTKTMEAVLVECETFLSECHDALTAETLLKRVRAVLRGADIT